MSFPQTSFNDGFTITEGVLPPERCADMAEEMERLARGPDSPVGRAGCRELLRRSSCVRTIAATSSVRKLVEGVLGTSAFAVKALWFDKSFDANWHVGWHQDNMIAVAERRDVDGYTAWSTKQGAPHTLPPQEVLAAMATVRISVDASERENGPLMVLPGTHRWGLLSSERVRQLVATITPAPCLTGVGGAVLMSPLLLHASAKSTSEYRRRVLHLEFANCALPSPLQWRDRVE